MDDRELTTPERGAELIERIWARDPSVWTGGDEAQWLGWLDEPARMLERVQELLDFGDGVLDDGLDAFVLLGMGGSSLAPEVLRRSFGARTFHVLDTTHPTAVARLRDALHLDRTLFIVSSKSGSTLETRSHADFFWKASGEDGRRFAAVTDPGSQLEQVARERGYRAVFPGEPTIGGRYSALSPFGLVPAVLMGIDVERLLQRAEEMREACRLADGNPGVELGLRLGEGWREGRDKVCLNPNPGGFGLWVEQLIAESTGKEGKGIVPAPDEDPAAGPDRQPGEVRVEDPYELGQEFFRWEIATAVAGSILDINPFDQPDVQSAKDRTGEILRAGEAAIEPESSVDELLGQAEPGKDYVAIQAFVDPAREGELEPLVARARATGCVVTVGLGPRYLHSTGQLHKGGSNNVLALQVVDDLGEELAIPGQEFGFRRLISAQAAGDYASLKERGRRVARVRLEEVTR
jgi:transaldolase/glucose-6-phosphate isomerase